MKEAKNEITRKDEADVVTYNFKNPALNEESVKIHAIGRDISKFRMELCKSLGKIADGKLYEEDGFKSVAEYAAKVHGFEEDLANMYARVGKRFFINDTETSNKLTAMFQPSLLNELTTLTDEELSEAVKSGNIAEGMSQKALRDAKSAIKASGKSGKSGNVLKDYEIHADIVEGSNHRTVDIEKGQLETLTDDARLSGNFIKKVIVPEGKREGVYHRGVQFWYDEESGNSVTVKYGISTVAPAKKGKGKKMSGDEISAYLAAGHTVEELIASLG